MFTSIQTKLHLDKSVVSVLYENAMKETTQLLKERYAILSKAIFLEKQNFYCVDILTAKCSTYYLLNIVMYQGH